MSERAGSPAAVHPPMNRPIPSARAAAAARGDDLRARGLAAPLCWLPAPQEPVASRPMPGPRADGKFWFE
jgi:hypothetical protein